MRTVTYDETQWKLVPIEPSIEMLSSITGYNEPSSYDVNIVRRDYSAALQAAPPYPEDENVNLVNAALGVLRDIECSHRPPIPELIPCGTMVYVRLSALAELHKAVYGKYPKEGDLNYMYAHDLAAPKGEE